MYVVEHNLINIEEEFTYNCYKNQCNKYSSFFDFCFFKSFFEVYQTLIKEVNNMSLKYALFMNILKFLDMNLI